VRVLSAAFNKVSLNHARDGSKASAFNVDNDTESLGLFRQEESDGSDSQMAFEQAPYQNLSSAQREPRGNNSRMRGVN